MKKKLGPTRLGVLLFGFWKALLGAAENQYPWGQKHWAGHGLLPAGHILSIQPSQDAPEFTSKISGLVIKNG